MTGAADSRSGHQLAYLDRRRALARVRDGAVVLFPLGAFEQHGEHLPLLTDALLAEEVCLRVAEVAATDVLVMPPLWTGFSPHHASFGATISLTGETFLRCLREVLASLRVWAPRVLVVNGHGGNRGLLAALALETGIRGLSYWEPRLERIGDHFPADASIGHAGEAETSMMLAAFRSLVGTPAADFEPPGDAALVTVELGSSGVIGDATAASGVAGERFLDAVVASLADHVDALYATEQGVHP